MDGCGSSGMHLSTSCLMSQMDGHDPTEEHAARLYEESLRFPHNLGVSRNETHHLGDTQVTLHSLRSRFWDP